MVSLQPTALQRRKTELNSPIVIIIKSLQSLAVDITMYLKKCADQIQTKLPRGERMIEHLQQTTLSVLQK